MLLLFLLLLLLMLAWATGISVRQTSNPPHRAAVQVKSTSRGKRLTWQHNYTASKGMKTIFQQLRSEKFDFRDRLKHSGVRNAVEFNRSLKSLCSHRPEALRSFMSGSDVGWMKGGNSPHRQLEDQQLGFTSSNNLIIQLNGLHVEWTGHLIPRFQDFLKLDLNHQQMGSGVGPTVQEKLIFHG